MNIAALFTVLLFPLTAASTPYPLNKEFVGTCGTHGKDDCYMVEIRCKVVKDNDRYLYTYTLRNKSKRTSMMVTWPVIDRASYKGSGLPLWWTIKPQQEITISLRHNGAPFIYTGMLQLMMKSDEGLRKLFEKQGATIPPVPFHYCNSFGQPGPLPQAYITERK